MTTFDPENCQYTITFKGNSQEYFNTLRALASVIATCDPSQLEPDALYYTSKLLQNMLPDPSQFVEISTQQKAG